MILYFGVIAIIIGFTLLSWAVGINFLSRQNIGNILVQCSIIAIVGLGQSCVIITGGIDLSVGSMVGFTGIISAVLIRSGMPIWGAFLIGIVAGTSIGFINGLGVSYGKIPSFIMTLGMLGIVRGATLGASGNKPIAGFSQVILKLANTLILGIPSFIVFMGIIYIIMVIVMSRTIIGRYVYAIGGNVKAANLSGINTKLIGLIAYGLSGLFSSIAGVMLLSRLAYASPTAGEGYELNSIAAVVLGGIALSGGVGKIYNTLVGAVILSILKAGLQILNVSTYAQSIVIGVVIIIAVFLDKFKERRAE